MQITRLLQLTLILLKRKQITAKEAAARFDVSQRTIYRDVDALSLAKIPVYSVKGRNGGIFLDEDFSLEQLLFDEDLAAGLQVLSAMGLPENEELLRQLNALYPPHDWLELDFSALNQRTAEIFQKAKKAIQSQKSCQIVYMTELGQTRQLSVTPLKLIYRGHEWYWLVSTETKLLPILLQRVQMIQLLEEQSTSVVSQAAIDFSEISVTLRFSKRVGYKRYDDFAHLTPQLEADGSFILKLSFSSLAELYGFLLPYGKNIQIVEPPELKEKVYALAESFLSAKI